MTTPSNLPMAEVQCEHNLAGDCLDVFVVTCRTPTATHVLLPLEPCTIQNVPKGDWFERMPAFRLDRESAAALMNGLWNAGVRPTNGEGGSATAMEVLRGRIEDLKEHIADLRATAGLPDRSPAHHGTDVPLTMPPL